QPPAPTTATRTVTHRRRLTARAWPRISSGRLPRTTRPLPTAPPVPARILLGRRPHPPHPPRGPGQCSRGSRKAAPPDDASVKHGGTVPPGRSHGKDHADLAQPRGELLAERRQSLLDVFEAEHELKARKCRSPGVTDSGTPFSCLPASAEALRSVDAMAPMFKLNRSLSRGVPPDVPGTDREAAAQAGAVASQPEGPSTLPVSGHLPRTDRDTDHANALLRIHPVTRCRGVLHSTEWWIRRWHCEYFRH
ncbi:hypothetical protein GA0115238_10421, partial [Streptomyces sp. di50b]